MGVRPSRHASRVSAADTRDPSVLGSETSALRRAANCAARGWYLPSIDVRAVKTRFTIFPGRVPRRQAASDHMPRCPLTTRHHPQRAPCGLRPRPARCAHTHAPQLPAHGPRCPPALLAHGNHICTNLPHTRIRTRPPHSTVPGPPLCAPLLHKRTTSRAQPTQLSAIAS